MSNIFDFCEKFNISLAKARKMDKAGFLRLDDSLPDASAEIRRTLANGDDLTAAQLVELVENPGAMMDLGRYATRAEEQIAALGRVEAAPKEIAAHVTFAAKGEDESVQALCEWLCEIIPFEPVGHSFIAVRLLLGIPANIRHFDVPRIPRALLECRKREEFVGWWRVEKRKSRNVTIYQRPAKITLDL